MCPALPTYSTKGHIYHPIFLASTYRRSAVPQAIFNERHLALVVVLWLQRPQAVALKLACYTKQDLVDCASMLHLGVVQRDIESQRTEVLSMSCIYIGRSLEKRKRSPSISSVSLRFSGASGAVSEAGGGGGLRARMKESSAVDLTFVADSSIRTSSPKDFAPAFTIT